ncbi:uncharacterized protein [Zea mays]|uniref:Uncharacterized protein n=1 Tax=Zea mays TaxID=4577 RepID=C0PKJ2_MAIZE|nr:uncharacterized protein LOC118473292 [Zea mays]ACN35708.1 unknown [Zea mays]|eukprot:XP_023156875.1 uncharacterized protein LOC111590176 [Zea mays]
MKTHDLTCLFLDNALAARPTCGVDAYFLLCTNVVLLEHCLCKCEMVPPVKNDSMQNANRLPLFLKLSVEVRYQSTGR